MLEPLKICTNKIHEFVIFNMLVVWQVSNDIWAITNKKDNRNTFLLALFKTESETEDTTLYNIIIWRLNIKFGFFK